MADPTPPPADRAPLITMTELNLAALRLMPRLSGRDALEVVLGGLQTALAELDAQRRARWVEQRLIERFMSLWIDQGASDVEVATFVEEQRADVRKEQGA